jgi:hypothetical protein
MMGVNLQREAGKWRTRDGDITTEQIYLGSKYSTGIYPSHLSQIGVKKPMKPGSAVVQRDTPASSSW